MLNGQCEVYLNEQIYVKKIISFPDVTHSALLNSFNTVYFLLPPTSLSFNVSSSAANTTPSKMSEIVSVWTVFLSVITCILTM